MNSKNATGGGVVHPAPGAPATHAEEPRARSPQASGGGGRGRGYDRMKRATDVLGAVIGLLLLAPLAAVVAAVVWHALGRPVLFRQQRPGRGGAPFWLIKFRTMRAVDEAAGLVSDADRLTRVGRALRETSLDELPTLWNVLRGEMSLVGPRPLLMQYLPRYSAQQARRHEVRPGITGLAQVCGRNGLSWPDKLALDVWYVDHRSALLDRRILSATVATVLRRQGISARGEATASEFCGQADSSHPAPGPQDTGRVC